MNIMKPFQSLLFAAGALSLPVSVLAAKAVQNNFDKNVMTVYVHGPIPPSGYDGYIADVQLNGRDSGAFCFLSPDASMESSNADVSQSIAEGVLKLGGNSMHFYECTTANCSQKTLVGTYNFTLSKTNNGTYTAQPAVYKFNYTSNGVPCHWDSSPSGPAAKLLQIRR